MLFDASTDAGMTGHPTPARVVFACIHNAGRSQMAAALFNASANPALATAISAGTAPGPHVHPVVVAAMGERGIDLSHARPQLLTNELAAAATMLITMGCGEACPHVPGLAREDWPLEDPGGRSLDEVRAIRDDIVERVGQLLTRRGWT
jgi:arsenate reductase (thioredoxin)